MLVTNFYDNIVQINIQMLKVSLTSPETSGFFSHVVLTTIEDREKRNIIRHDMINILNEIKKGSYNTKTKLYNGTNFIIRKFSKYILKITKK